MVGARGGCGGVRAGLRGQCAIVKAGMFNTMMAPGYGYDDSGREGASPVRVGSTSNYAGDSGPTSDRLWSDATGYPTIDEGGKYASYTQSNSYAVVNRQGSYTPTGTGGTSASPTYAGTGMYIASPVDASGNPLNGTTTLTKGAQFKTCLKIVATSEAGAGAPTGWNTTNTYAANLTTLTTSAGTLAAMSGSALAVSWENWSIAAGADANAGLWVGSGCYTVTTQSDLSAASDGTHMTLNQLLVAPEMITVDGLGNGAMLFCSTISAVSASFTATVNGSAVTATPQILGATTTCLRAKYDQSVKHWGSGTKIYTGTC